MVRKKEKILVIENFKRSNKVIQREENSAQKINEIETQIKEEAKIIQWGEIWQILSHKEYQKYKEMEQEDQKSIS